MTSEKIENGQQISIREGLFDAGFKNLLGSRCAHCGEVGLGSRTVCANCGKRELEVFPLSSDGSLWTYTVIRHEPPGDYKGPKPFQPYGVGLVELPEGIMVLSVLECDVEKLQVGLPMILKIFSMYQDDDSNDVMTFVFKPSEEAA